MTKRARGVVVVVVAVVLVGLGIAVSVARSRALSDSLRHVVAEAEQSYRNFDVRTAAENSVPLGAELLPSSLPDLEGAKLYRATFGPGNRSVEAIYVVTGPLAAEGCVTVSAAANGATTVSSGGCNFG